MKNCWQSPNLEDVRLQLLNMHSARELIEVILQLSREKRRLITCLLGAWWSSRNKANAGEGSRDVDEVTCRATTFANCSYQFDNKPTHGTDQGRRTKEKWLPLLLDVLKINTDGAFREAEEWGLGFHGQILRQSWCLGWIRTPEVGV